MKKFALLLGVLCSTIGLAQEKIQWMSIEEAEELAQTSENPKKIFIDVYTDWCGWCKKMDQRRMSKITEMKKLAVVRMKGLGEGEANELVL